jgi:hypothetical protein
MADSLAVPRVAPASLVLGFLTGAITGAFAYARFDLWCVSGAVAFAGGRALWASVGQAQLPAPYLAARAVQRDIPNSTLRVKEENHDDEQTRFLDGPACRGGSFVNLHTRHGRKRIPGNSA